MSNSILITGGAGFIGRHLVERLLQNNDSKIIIIDNLSNSAKGALSNTENRRIVFYKEDLRNKETISDIIKREKVDICVHLAAKISVADSVKNPEDTITVNVNGTFSVLDACAHNNVKKFIFASSAAVYGDAKVIPITERCSLNPLSPYAASKVAGETLCASYVKSGKIKNAISLRFFNVYGKGQSPQYAGVITKFAQRLSKKLPPVILGDGKQTRDFIFAGDVAKAIICAIDVETSDVFNIGTGIPISVNQLANIMIRSFGLDIEPQYLKREAFDIIHSYANIQHAKTELGFVSSVDLLTYVENNVEALIS
jgi:UDP-glucose 4-epimerase